MKKRILIVISACSLFSIVQASQVSLKHEVSLTDPITSSETACFDWFEETKRLINFNYTDLSTEDQNIIVNRKLTYQDNPKAVTQAMQHCAQAFCTALEKAHQQSKYDPTLLGNILLKVKIHLQNADKQEPTDSLSVRMYVFKKMLTPEEQSTVLKDNYLRNPEATRAAMTKAGKCVAQWLAKLNLIENTQEAQAKAAQEYTETKMADFKKIYGA